MDGWMNGRIDGRMDRLWVDDMHGYMDGQPNRTMVILTLFPLQESLLSLDLSRIPQSFVCPPACIFDSHYSSGPGN